MENLILGQNYAVVVAPGIKTWAEGGGDYLK